ncbi:GNAT superfamily N-acetyltransferase [Sporomusaceae bacterium BoRhaA]|uniref:GNAT family N-acetyltransferase n=1 Tax=Pelorhabdus rhamnosifermentans TaxID=2772457 RepID=UPI001C0643C2|nr:GNAT family N-acetyltransferase [Pelorhabdus rhamnosifermentans]MBU2699503.1 GNAT superfamily N-acetyltransferase [Pelorhabdus rhamnosifermentans]
MGIRNAKISDWKEIMELLQQLDYSDTDSFLQEKIKTLLDHPDERLLVYEYDEKIVAFISIHFIPQVALKGDFARISYFAVDKKFRSKGIGREIEEHCAYLAEERKCDRIEVHSHSRRVNAHRFYCRQGFVESPKYFIKKV